MSIIKRPPSTSQQGAVVSRMDSNESVYFLRQLEYIRPQVYEVLYTELSAFRMFPISTDAGNAAKTITYRVRDSVGSAKIIAGYGDDLPRVNVFRREVTTPVRSIGASYGWNLQDIRSAMMAGVNLQADDAQAAVRAHNQLINTIAWHGDDEFGLSGLGTSGVVTNVSAAVHGAWLGATGAEILEDVGEMILSIIDASNGVESPNVVAFPPAHLAFLAARPWHETGGTDTTVLTFLRNNWPGIEFTSCVELKAWSGVDDAMIAYRRDPTKLALEIPQGYEELPVQPDGLEFMVPTHSRCGGLVVRYPASIAIRTGIQGGS